MFCFHVTNRQPSHRNYGCPGLGRDKFPDNLLSLFIHQSFEFNKFLSFSPDENTVCQHACSGALCLSVRIDNMNKDDCQYTVDNITYSTANTKFAGLCLLLIY